jgi:hypothetical protein
MGLWVARGVLFHAGQRIFHLRNMAWPLLLAMAGRYRVSDQRVDAHEALVPVPLWEVAMRPITRKSNSQCSVRKPADTLEPRIKQLREANGIH